MMDQKYYDELERFMPALDWQFDFVEFMVKELISTTTSIDTDPPYMPLSRSHKEYWQNVLKALYEAHEQAHTWGKFPLS
jgi:hypothetical protein